MSTLELQIKILDPEEMKPGDRPFEFGLAIIGTTLEQRQSAIILLRKAVEKIEEDTMKKFGTGKIIPEPDEQHESALDRGIADVEAGRVAPLDLDAAEAAVKGGD